MENQQMGMPAEMAAPAPNPEEMAVYDRMRQEISPQEFSNEMLASASQVDPQAVAEFTEELQSLDISPEELDALNDLVDEVLASPEQYDQLRKKYLSQGMPDDILPEQFDPYFFAALNMAVDQMIAAPTGVQAFADGGIAELKPIAKAIASYGRNGDTMLAHITPAEARMLRRRGGSGTINPATGLPEFFLKKAFKSIGNAVKKFANSTVGRIVTTVALGFFLGPAAASFLGATSVAGVAAVSGFVGSAGATLLGGGNLKDALKAGAVGGITAGAGAGIMGGSGAFQAGSYTGPTTIGGQFDKFKSAITPGAPAITPTGQVAGQMPVPEAGAPAAGVGPNQMPVPDADPLGKFIQQNEAARAAANAPAGGSPSIFEQGKRLFNENISPSGIREGATPAAQKAGADAVNALTQRIPTATPAMQEAAYQTAFKAAMPGIVGTYGPMTAVGLGALGAFGGFQSKPVESGPITGSLMKPVTQRIRESGTQRERYMQGLPGVVYDDMGAPVFGQSTRLPTYDVPDYNYGGFNTPGAGGQGIMNLPTTYIPPAGAIGSRSVAQPYNTASMYSNLVPRGYEDGGEVAPVAPLAAAVTPPAKTPAELAAERQAMLETMAAQQRAGRDKANQARAMRRAAGSGSMYANINAGLSALAPENNPMDLADTTFGSRNRQAQLANLQQTYAPMLQGQRSAMTQQAAAMGQPAPNIPSPYTTAPAVDRYSQMVQDQYARIGRAGFGGQTNQIDIPGFTGFVNQLQAGQMNPADLRGRFDASVQQYMQDNPNDRYTQYVQQYQRNQQPITTMPVTPSPNDFRDMEYRPGRDYDPRTGMPMSGTQGGNARFMNTGGIAGLAQGGYPRRTGQISGPGTEKSDDIPAMLSDGEFVMTAKAVRGAGKGSRRAGAKQMYKLMHQLEKNAERG